MWQWHWDATGAPVGPIFATEREAFMWLSKNDSFEGEFQIMHLHYRKGRLYLSRPA